MEPDSLHSSAAFADDVHEYLRQRIQFADQKAAFVFAAGATMLGIVYTQSNGRYISYRFDWEKFAAASIWIDKTIQ